MELTAVAPPNPTASSGTVALRITVLAGGPSAEREVSLDSGRAIADALRRRGHDVCLADIGPGDLSALDQPADVVFPALHGTWGEDGQLQAILERRGVPFVGSGSCASRLAMDKLAAKRAVAALGLDTPAFELVTSASAPCWAPRLPPPLIVKPVDQGSSVLTVIAPRHSDARRGVEAVVARFGRALVERFIPGDEITVGIIDGQPLPPICVRPKADFYDYDAKYRDDRTEYLFDAGHGAALYRRAAENSARVFAALGCRHLARVDWIADRAGRLWFLEVNTLPGFTSHSLVPKAAARAGIPFDELVERLAHRPLRGGDV
ncbi:MAG: D-alanine--D-alanine ligase [Phycisphaerae bacterium]|nr:D-alanine--D-alanine ligase [Phycisphaerae bacterium]MCZ2400964.1 D-alanine--D-alanine ligase [Phycisphaerae bacterium]NUQ50632.1 D-alanine--D-alanine ligase [Phycisphaerae bacterium]